MSFDRDFKPQFVQTGDPTTVNEADPPYAIGQKCSIYTVKNVSAGVDPGLLGKTFRFVRVDSAAPVAPFRGAVVWWSDKTACTVTTSATNRGQVAGVLCAATPQLGNWGYIQIGGRCTVKFIDAPTAAPTVAGLIVVPSATNAKADCLASASAATFPLLGRSDGAYVPALAEGVVNLDLPEAQ